MVSKLEPFSKGLPCFRHDLISQPRSNLTPEEKSSYLHASVCLTQEPAKLGLGSSKTRWDELQYNHINQVSWIHFVVSHSHSHWLLHPITAGNSSSLPVLLQGQFLPWHRYFVSVHRSILRDECGYTGRLPLVPL